MGTGTRIARITWEAQDESGWRRPDSCSLSCLSPIRVGTWLHRLAVNVILARRTTLGTERGRYDDSADVLDDVAGRPAAPELSMDFEEAIGRLPDGARQVFVLHDIEGYRHDEIADMLGIVTGTSKSQLHHARMALRRHLYR